MAIMSLRRPGLPGPRGGGGGAASVPLNVPLPLVLALCIASGLVGYTSHWLKPPPDAVVVAAVPQVSLPTQLLEHAEMAQRFLNTTGLLQLRPPLLPAPSGDAHYTLSVYQVLSLYPRIVVFPNFIDAQRATKLVSLASSRMAPSDVAWREGEKHDPKQQIRTSSGVFLTRCAPSIKQRRLRGK